MNGKVGIDFLPQFIFHVVNLGLNVGSDTVSKILVSSGVHGEGKTQEEVEKGGWVHENTRLKNDRYH
jgi:hypothetical protein